MANDLVSTICLATPSPVAVVPAMNQQMYRAAGLKLNTYHMGGDEVGAGSWTASPQCQALFAKALPGVAGVADLKPYFVSKVADLLHKRQLALGGLDIRATTQQFGRVANRQRLGDHRQWFGR